MEKIPRQQGRVETDEDDTRKGGGRDGGGGAERQHCCYWSDRIPLEILSSILRKVYLIDFIRARAVCVSWRAAVEDIIADKRKHRSPTHQLPWLILWEASPRQCKPTLPLFNLSDSKIYRLPFQQKGSACVLGSYNEWLVMTHKTTREYFLLNISSSQEIQLPRQAYFPGADGQRAHSPQFCVYDAGVHSQVMLSSDPNSGEGACIVVMVFPKSKILAFCRLGDAAWTVFSDFKLFPCLFYNGRLVVARRRGDSCITFYELDDTRLEFTEWGTFSLHQTIKDLWLLSCNTYLVESCHGELLMVLRACMMEWRDGVRILRTKGFRVFKLDGSGSSWIEVESLGSQLIFLGDGSSKSLCAESLPGFKGNCIYFPYDHSHDVVDFKSKIENKTSPCVFDMEDKSIKPFHFHRMVHLPITWVTPYPT